MNINLLDNDDYDEFIDEEELRCQKCKWYYCHLTKPYILPCNHNICQKCLESLKNDQINICPFCKKIFNIKELDLLQVNYTFLNLVNKIMITKIIFCKECNKISYWKEHFSKCNQANFIDPFNIIKDIKNTCERSINSLKLYNNRKILFANYKNSIIINIKKIKEIINKKNENNIKNVLDKLFIINSNLKSIDFIKYKKYIFNFLELCLQYKNNFNINELLNNLEIASPGYINNYKNKKNKLLTNIYPHRNNLININNNFKDKSNHNINIIKNQGRVGSNLRLFNKKENNKVYLIKINEEKIISNNSNNKRNYVDNKINIEKNEIIKRTKTESKTKYKKVNILDLLDQQSLEMESLNKIIVGLKNVQVLKYKIKKEYDANDKSKKNIININQIKQLDNNSSQKNFISRSYKKNNKQKNFILKDKDKEKEEKHKEIFHGNFLRPIDKSIRINLKDRYKNSVKEDSIPIIIEEEKENEDKIKNFINEEVERKVKNNEIKKMSLLFKEFNKIKEVINDLKEYNSLINYISEYINENIEKNILLLNNIITYNYNSLLNNILVSYNPSRRQYIISIIDNTKQIILFDIINKEYKYLTLSKYLKDKNNLNNSMCIEFNDRNLIFLSGGHTYIENESTDNFLIINIEKENIEIDSKMPYKKSFHSNIFLDEKLYIIGGINDNNKCSSNCFYYSVNADKWHILPKLNKARKNCSLCAQNKSILYVFRGSDDNNDLDSIEYLDLLCINNDSWKIFEPIDYGYTWFPAKNSLVLSYSENKILICGGEDHNGNIFKETYLFDTKNGNIYRGNDLLYGASFRNIGCIYNDEIFAIDIKNDCDNCKKIGIHSYNLQNNEWKMELV